MRDARLLRAPGRNCSGGGKRCSAEAAGPAVTAARQFDTLFVEAYRDAAAAGSDMRLAADLLEHARALADGSATTLEGAVLFEEWIASAVQSEGLCAILGRVRDAVLTGKLEAELANFRD